MRNIPCPIRSLTLPVRLLHVAGSSLLMFRSQYIAFHFSINANL